MLRPVKGVLVVEGVQTGDGRFIVADATTWADPPLPIAFIEDGDQHVEPREAPQVGNILTLTRTGGLIEFTGHVDDESDAGAELIRRMLAGAASNGPRQFLSIDPDDWAYEIVDTTEQLTGTDTVVASANGTGSVPVLTAAAGDGEPVGVIVYEEGADSYVQRFTRLRIRGVTACAVPAFDGAYMELSDATEPVTEDAPAEPAVVVAAASARPARDVFYVAEPELGSDLLVEQFDSAGNPIGFAVPLTITDDHRVFFHLAVAGQCHVGYESCINPPMSAAGYAHFHTGEVVCDDGTRVATGRLVVGCDHAAAQLIAPQAREHYDNTGLGWADVRMYDGVFGPWGCGTLVPGLDDATVRMLRSTSLSGDWRRIGGNLELIAAQSVNTPGFPVARETLAASAVAELPQAGFPHQYVENGVTLSLVAATPVTRCADCARRHEEETELASLKRMMDLRTAHLLPAARDAALASIRKS